MRGVLTWREAHRVLVRLEEADNNSRAIVWAVGRTEGPSADAGGGARGGGRGGERKRRGAEAEEEEPKVAPIADGGGGGQQACFEMRDKKTCKFGDACRFSHDAKVMAAARKEKSGGKKGGDKGSEGKGHDRLKKEGALNPIPMQRAQNSACA